ncbi:MIP family channel protein [Nocardioides silvaticus]|uniref:MIP family channel protein n=1 Tax=Nocardioides silvaticus TaxID=2201891 RepID=A0A316TJJ6_9ACTN|nr:aquaporin [Nocardioides silvaticus]PWN04630.1 MIP family channel protein [Nocardioides silvaticus]
MSETTAQMPAADTTPPSQMQKLVAEAIGTFVLVFFGAGTAFASGGDYVATALAFGLTVLIMAYAVGHLSGGHFNPAVSIGAALAGRVSWATAAVYIAVQFIAAFVAAGMLAIIAVLLYDGAEWGDVLASVSNKWDTGPAANGAAFLGAFLAELIGTFVFVFMILAVTDRRRASEKIPAPVAIGLGLTLCHLLLIGITGCSVNPARSIGPGILSFNWDDAMKYQWLFLIAPVLGAAAAGLLHPLLFGRDGTQVPGSGLDFKGAGDAFQQQWAQQSGGVAAAQVPVDQQQPIIQDGWQWDPAAQQWIPAQQHQPPAPQAPQAQQPPQQGGWAPPPGDQTVVRPPDA